ISATKCGEVSKTIYTATFDSSVDSTIVDPFTITKTVEGDVLQHDWVFDTENVVWEGNDSDGYTKASITKTCKNTVHDGENNITVSSANIEKNIEPATEEDNTERTYYTAIFNSENDKDITTEFTVKKVVTKQIMPGCEFNVTSNVEWEEDEQGGYKSVTISKNYINSVTSSIEKTERVKSTKIESSVKAATECEQPSITTYTATFDSTVDPDIKTAFTVSSDVEGEILKHDWEYDTENAVLSQEGQERYLITITKTCNNKEHTGNNPVSVTSDKVTISTGAAVTCGKHTTITYTATFDSTVDSDITEAFDVEIEAEGPIQEHNWSVVSVESDGSFDTAPTKATMTLKCDICNTEKSIVITGDGITAGSITAENKTYTYTVTVDGKTYTKDLTFKPTPVQPNTVITDPVTPVPSHTTHEYEVKFTWKTDTSPITVTAESTCKNGGENKSLAVTLSNRIMGSYTEYTATTTDPNGKQYSETKHIDKNGIVKDGSIPATPSVEDGDIIIIGVEETYPYTGSKIKPVIQVMDGDILLAESTDYTYKVTGKNKIGEINKVEISGKGNYAGKSATATFKIVDPRDEIDASNLAGSVKKVKLSEKEFTYDGTAKYPATVTVILKDKTEIVYTYNGDGGYDTDNEKKVGLSICNNVKKGTATVGAIGSGDKAAKKATFTIKAADISTAEFEISAVDWAVKAATPEIKGTIKLGEEEVELVAGQDYKVTFTAKDAGKGTGIAKISGKGNFKGKHDNVKYNVNALELTENNIIVKAVAGKKVKDVKVTVVDGDGNAVKSKLYSVAIYDAAGEGTAALDKKAALPEKINVVVTASGNVKTDEDGVSVEVEPKGDIAKVKKVFKVDKAFAKYYTGEPITLDADDFGPTKIAVGDLKYDEDFKIVGYKNNIKKGTMTVTVQGIGVKYSGTKTFKVKIKAKPFDKAIQEDKSTSET
ncbi:MAG: hypothetical protein J5723_07400, partial [Ruminococcus sp.]|nr:hypothetical protein [Ruminococcus sp.]